MSLDDCQFGWVDASERIDDATAVVLQEERDCIGSGRNIQKKTRRLIEKVPEEVNRDRDGPWDSRLRQRVEDKFDVIVFTFMTVSCCHPDDPFFRNASKFG